MFERFLTLVIKDSDQKTKYQRLEMRREKVEQQIVNQGKLLMSKTTFTLIRKDSDQKTKAQRLEMRGGKVEEQIDNL